MDNPYKSPAYEEHDPSAGSLQFNALLLLLAIIAAWMLTKDVQHLLAIHNGLLKNAAEVSVFHYIYIKFAPLEIACFRIFSSLATLLLIILAARNKKFFALYYLPTIAYGITQLIYQALAIAGVTAILTQTTGRSIIETSFWFSPEVLPNTIQVLFNFLIILAPSVLFLTICHFMKSSTSRAITVK